jgi:O-antigen/teichoic acid export membrane protein
MRFAALVSEREDDLRQKTIASLGWTGMSQASQQIAQFVTTAVLAHILTPAEFGLIGLLLVFTGFIAVFSDFGFTAALIQRPDLREEHLRSAFWLNAAAGIVLAAATLALAPAIAAFYGKPQLLGLTALLALTFLFNAIGIVPFASLQRAMAFRNIALIENITLLGASAAGILAAIAGLGVWSLALIVIVSSGLRTLLLWLASSWRPRWGVERGAMKELWGFSAPLVAFNSLNYWNRNADNLLIGRFIGVTALGFYTRAYNLMLLPTSLVSTVATRVMFPTLSRLQEDPTQVKRVYLRAVALIALVTFPAIVGLFVLCRPFILTVYGSKWASVVPILQILCFTALLQSVSTTVGWIYQALGRTDWMFRWGIASAVVVVSSFFAGLHWGVEGVAAAYTAATLVLFYPGFAIPGSLIGLKVGEIVVAVSGVLAACTFMGVSVWIVETLLPGTWGPAIHLSIGVPTGVIAYASALRIFSPRPYQELRALIVEFDPKRLAFRPGR